ncbi:Germin protein subfamily 3 member 4 [Spatholobus suberectus]|nr:Germin protein subfamily 3 member 4 [Spatholobus suberectus]
MLLFFVAFTNIQVCLGDCDNLQDTCPAVPPNKQTIFINGLQCKTPVNVTSQDFRTTELSNAGSTEIFGASMKIVRAAEFNGLNTLGLSIGRADLDGKGLVNFHYHHPRATEMIFVTKGVLVAGFVDTKNQYFQKYLKVGDVFVFPKALFHFGLNYGFEEATTFSVYNSQNPGFVSLRQDKEETRRICFSPSVPEASGVLVPQCCPFRGRAMVRFVKEFENYLHLGIIPVLAV